MTPEDYSRLEKACIESWRCWYWRLGIVPISAIEALAHLKMSVYLGGDHGE